MKLSRMTKDFIKRILENFEIKSRSSLVENIMFIEKEWEDNLKITSGKRYPSPRSIGWFIPYFANINYGGIYTILRFANQFETKGIKNYLFFYGVPPNYILDFKKEKYVKIIENFPNLKKKNFTIYNGPHVNVLPKCDYSIATLWTSAYLLLKFNKTAHKLYFCQDDETSFYGAGSFSEMTKLTYQLGFEVIANTRGLFDYLKNEYRVKGTYFTPGVDDIYRQSGSAENRKRRRLRIFFYTRPTHERNGFELSVSIMRAVRNSFPNSEIITAGEEWNNNFFGLNFVNNLGLLRLEDTAKLYKTCDYGIVLMFTKHPSYIPLELMSCGVIVITNHNKYTSWLFKNRTNCISVEPIPYKIISEIRWLEYNPKIKEKIRFKAKEDIKRMTWDKAFSKVNNYLYIK